MSASGRLIVTLLSALLGAATAAGQGQSVQVEYVVAVKDTAAHLFHVTTTISNLRQHELKLALPVWTPGWYTLEYYARNVRAFTVTDSTGKRLRAPITAAQEWTVDTRGLSQIIVDFDYFAHLNALNQANVSATRAFFTGTQLFLEPLGHREASYRIRFLTPSGWPVATSLAETADSTVFLARNYDDAADAVTWLGPFHEYRFLVDGKPHIVVTSVEWQYPKDMLTSFGQAFTRMVSGMQDIFGGLPYDKYLVFWIPGEADTNAAGALEHGNSYVSCCGGPTTLTVNRYTAHEFFHAWNVKRIRPAEHWPYDYSRPVDTPSLWFSEGVTDYYGLLTALRTGLTTDSAFILDVATTIEDSLANPERVYVSPSDASMVTWRDYLGEPVSYYAAGFVLGALLDLSVLQDTQGRRGLDDVMRALYFDFYQRDRGFTPSDLVRTVSSVAGRDYSSFFSRFVTGTDTPPYDSIFDFAGVRVYHATNVRGLIMGFGVRVQEGLRLDSLVAGGGAAAAGLRKNDVIVAVDGVPVSQVQNYLPNGCCFDGGLGDETKRFTVLRSSQLLDVAVKLRPLPPTVTKRAEFKADISAAQLAVRRAWLRKPR